MMPTFSWLALEIVYINGDKVGIMGTIGFQQLPR